MDQTQQLIALVVAAGVGTLATLASSSVASVTRRTRISSRENLYAASTEGEKRCPKCSMGNMWTDRNWINCGARLPG